MDIFKAGEGRIKYITLNNDTIKRSADRKVGRAFLYVYIYFGYPQKPYNTVQTVQTQAGQGLAHVRFLYGCTV